MSLRDARKIVLLLCCEDHCEDHCGYQCGYLVLIMRGGQAAAPGHGRHRTPRSVRRPEN